MKKYTYYILYGLLALSISCENKEEAGFSVDYTPMPVVAAGGETSFVIQTSGKWSASKTTSWITLTPIAGTGNQTVTVTVKGNEDDEQNTPQRTAKIYVLSGPDTETLTITQLGKNHPLPPAPVISGNAENQCPAEFTVTLEIAPAEHALSYVWYKNGEVIPAITAMSYTVTESGTYAVAGVNIAGEEGEKSEKAVVINPCILPAPVITPFKDTPCEMGLTITEPVAYAVSYIWYKDDVPTDVTAASYSAFESGTYTVAAVNEAGTKGEVSAGYMVTISPCLPAAAGAIQGASANNCSAGSATSKEANTVELTIPEIPLATSYTWYYNGGDGEVEMQTGDSRSYTAVISGSYTVKGVSPVGAGSPSLVKVVNITPCFTFAFGGNYTRIECNKTTLGDRIVEPFLSIYDNGFSAFSAANPTRTPVYYRLAFTSATIMTFTIGYASGGTTYVGSGSYTLTKTDDGILSFSSLTGTSAYLVPFADNMLEFFLYSGTPCIGPSATCVTVQPSSNRFRIGLAPVQGLTYPVIAFYLVSNPKYYVPGVRY
jgi:hypothetical protein